MDGLAGGPGSSVKKQQKLEKQRHFALLTKQKLEGMLPGISSRSSRLLLRLGGGCGCGGSAGALGYATNR